VVAVSVVAAEAVSVRAGAKQLLADVSFSAGEGEWISILGPNGAGKTTVLRALAGLTRFRGRVALAGESASSLSTRAIARRVAVVPQHPVVPHDMTVAEYVLLGRTPHLRPLAQEGPRDRRVAAAVVARLGLEPFSGRRLGSLSGGELQRVLIARALAQQAPILLLDEPTASLDIGHQQDVLELVDELRRQEGLTVVATMHDLSLVAQYGDRIVLLDGGRVVSDGAARDVLSAPRLEALYGATVRLVFDHGRLVAVVPLRASRPS
jgi:iron complex transport system ATP-binding protein